MTRIEMLTSINKYLLLISTIFFSVNTITFAKNETNKNNIVIPVIDKAQIFAELTDGTPAVLNYFTESTEDQIIDFYKNNYGSALFNEKKHNQLILVYKQASQTIRIVISQQGNKRQVDIIVK
jgi:hypothetical protein